MSKTLFPHLFYLPKSMSSVLCDILPPSAWYRNLTPYILAFNQYKHDLNTHVHVTFSLIFKWLRYRSWILGGDSLRLKEWAFVFYGVVRAFCGVNCSDTWLGVEMQVDRISLRWLSPDHSIIPTTLANFMVVFK